MWEKLEVCRYTIQLCHQLARNQDATASAVLKARVKDQEEEAAASATTSCCSFFTLELKSDRGRLAVACATGLNSLTLLNVLMKDYSG